MQQVKAERDVGTNNNSEWRTQLGRAWPEDRFHALRVEERAQAILLG